MVENKNGEPEGIAVEGSLLLCIPPPGHRHLFLAIVGGKFSGCCRLFLATTGSQPSLAP